MKEFGQLQYFPRPSVRKEHYSNKDSNGPEKSIKTSIHPPPEFLIFIILNFQQVEGQCGSDK